MSDATAGFAVRRKDTCGAMKDCEMTVEPFFACCPQGAECLRKANTFCCPEGEDCREELNNRPRCANPDWPMFNNPNDETALGYFCCEEGLRGYNSTETRGSSGCERTGEEIPGDWLDREVQAIVPTPSPTNEAPPDDDDGTPIAAIVGGTVGGVAALLILAAAVWWFRRRKRRQAQTISLAQDEYEYKAPAYPAAPMSPRELGGQMPPRELGGDSTGAPLHRKELPGQHGTSELAA